MRAVEGRRTTLAQAGKSERWLQDWIAEEPARLGLGQLETAGQEVHYSGAGTLDLVLADDNRVYAVELQLGEVDESHAMRTLDYWSRNRRIQPDRSHVAVIGAETARGRYRVALEALAEALPLIVIELHFFVGGGGLALEPRIVIASAELGLSVVPTATQLLDRTPADWHGQMTAAARTALDELEEVARGALSALRFDYAPSSYIGVRRGRRLWATVNPVETGITLRLPDPDGARSHPSHAFETFAEALSLGGVPSRFQPGIRRPLAVRVRPGDAFNGDLKALLEWSSRALDPDEEGYTEHWGPPRSDPGYSYGEDWKGDVDPWYGGEFYEGPDHMSTYSTVTYHENLDESFGLWASEDLSWDDEDGKREFIRRLLVHHLSGAVPTKRQIDAVLKGPAGGWEDGQEWILPRHELQAFMWARGID